MVLSKFRAFCWVKSEKIGGRVLVYEVDTLMIVREGRRCCCSYRFRLKTELICVDAVTIIVKSNPVSRLLSDCEPGSMSLRLAERFFL